ncbi:hypothetical protein COZ82_00445 [Candidatus Kaiserbacteria bacterium CG_4_8_14_3_um_filter_38_9]|uniref:Uncharacterized protein n=1 Tax=Candidatus Kaiserbacteria bacterium CG_4_8_14_3_um_filter_38_9 TaxID=1974599 RepID=A0A2M7IPK9_9BACT|nr:MAG: hypothetical protein COZ82_00445 [Candidatus Kaiserbacteria bacterium CG_4_8_14_3_um_filter_38_9]
MDISTILATDLKSPLGLDDMTEDKRQQFLYDLSSVILEGALLHYLEKSEEDDQSVFSSWVQAHATDENLLPKLLKTYPQFGKTLTDEIGSFKTDVIRVTSGR